MTELDEPILDDDYPVFAGYLYVLDGRIYSSDITGKVRDLKARYGVNVVKRCDIVGRRNLLEEKEKNNDEPK